MQTAVLSKRDIFYRNLGLALYEGIMKSFIERKTLELLQFSADELDYLAEEEEDEEDEEETLQQVMNNNEKYLFIEPLLPRHAFTIMEDFAETVTNPHLQQQLVKALNGKKPFASFNHLVHNSELRQHWFTFRDAVHIQKAKEWIAEHADAELQETIKALPAVTIV